MEITHRDEKYNVIIDILKEKEGRRSRFNSLYREYINYLRTKKDYTALKKNTRGRKIRDIKNFTPSRNEFISILDKLIEDKYLTKKKENNYDYYVLTEYAISINQIKLLNKNDKQDIFKKIYKKLIIQEILKEEVKLNSHNEFDDLLAQLEINKKNIIWGSIVQNINHDIASLIYPDLFPETNRNDKQALTHELWKSTRNNSRIIPLELFCFPEYGYPYFEIYRTEYWKLNKNDKNYEQNNGFGRFDGVDDNLHTKVKEYLAKGKNLKCHHKNCNDKEYSSLQEYNIHCNRMHPKQPFYPELSLIKMMNLEPKGNPWE